MNDRELLELAAKAAGLHIDDWNCDMAVMYFWDGDPQNPERNHHYWSPLTDDGDAFRLAANLKMAVIHDDPAAVRAGWALTQPCPITRTGQGPWFWKEWLSDHHDDPCAATRRAIVRAAAEIGKATASPPECTPARPEA